MKHFHFLCLLLCLSALPSIHAIAQRPLMQQNLGERHITLRDGLPDNHVDGIFFTDDGRLGLRTQASLCLFDGVSFSTFPFPTKKQYYWITANIPHTEYVDSEQRVWAKLRHVLYVFDLKTEAYVEDVDSIIRSYGVDELLSNLFVDETNRLWFVLASGKLQMWDPATGESTVIEDSRMSKCGQVICINSNGPDCWMVYENGVIRCYNTLQRRFTAEDHTFEGRIAKDNQTIIRFHKSNFWLMWDKGLAYYDTLLHKWTQPEVAPLSDIDMYTCIDIDPEGNAYVGSGQSGTLVFDGKSLQLAKTHHYELEDGSTPQYNDITDILINPKDGSVWTASLFRGLFFFHPNCNHFPAFSTLKGSRQPDLHDFTRSFATTSDGTIYVGTNLGVYTFDRTNWTSAPMPQLAGQIIIDLYTDSKDRLWIGTFYNGLYCYQNGQLKNYGQGNASYKNYMLTSNVNNVRCIRELRDGRLAVGIFGGLAIFDVQTGTFTFPKENHPELSSFVYPTAIEQDGNGTLYVGTSRGVFCYNPTTDKVSYPFPDGNISNLLRADEIYNDILLDSRGIMWFATYSGIFGLNITTGETYNINTSNGLPSLIARSLIEDKDGNVWASTEQGLCRISLKEGSEPQVTSFQLDKGLLQNGYCSHARLRLPDGTLLFGGLGGFNIFAPSSLQEKFVYHHPVLKSLHVNGMEILPSRPGNGRVILQNSLSHTREIRLKHNENFVTIDFSGLNFLNPSQTYYRYRLEGYEEDWNEVIASNNLGHATYTGLPSGKYRLVVYSAISSVSGEKQWCETPTELSIVIAPPFYATIWAKGFYVLFAIALGWLVWRKISKRMQQRMEHLEQMNERRKEEELNIMKFNFFSNISHEFRTPLTLIITPLELLLKRLSNQRDRDQVASILRNARQLLGLVNQLLDFHKLERGGEKLNLCMSDFVEVAQQTAQSFAPLAEANQLELSFENATKTQKLMFCFDHDKVRKIINNLLSNAIKYTASGGEIHVTVEQKKENGVPMAIIRVSDTGVGIPENDLPRVFERFYQAANKPANPAASNGVGLHLVLSYARLHGGDAMVQSKEGEGTTFTITLPTNLTPSNALATETENILPQTLSAEQDAPCQPSNTENAKEDTDMAQSAPQGEETEAKTILVVEDNIEFRHFMKDALSADYTIITACDGQEGIQKTLRDNPDIIISDVMMPVMNGLEMCERLKTDINTSHIPIILLTARSSDEAKVKGYKVGADSYITKPFSMDVLTTRIEQLLQQLEQRRKRYRRDTMATPQSVAITPLDEQFIQDSLKAVEENIDKSDYSVNDLAERLLVTRTTLYRKMQGILGMTPKDFIRDIRLKRAAQLLNDSELTVSEIAYRVGFTSPRYFSKVFLATYGVLPSRYGKRAEEGDTQEEDLDQAEPDDTETEPNQNRT